MDCGGPEPLSLRVKARYIGDVEYFFNVVRGGINLQILVFIRATLDIY